jgi:hypothetical protein
MQNYINILLYSKFSTASRKLIEIIEDTNIKEFNLLCIDNKKVREKIENSQKLNIKEVPCIIRLNQNNGVAESFEGDKAFKLLQSYIDLLTSQRQAFQPPPIRQETVKKHPPSPVKKQDVNLDYEESYESPMEESSFESMNVSRLPAEKPPKQDSIQKQQKLINATSIEDLGSDINKGQTVNTYMHVPKSVEFDIDIENRQRTVKKDRSVKSGESGNIVNRALQMQKEREQESSMPGQRPIA